MFKQLMYKWFGLTPETPVCLTCEVLRDQLDKSDEERKDLLRRLLEKDKPEPPSIQSEAPIPITPAVVPWRVRQQMLEREDRQAAALLRNREREINVSKPDSATQDRIVALEEELGVSGTEGN